MSSTSASSASPSWRELEEQDRDIGVPENAYPSLEEGMKILGMPANEFKKLYETCQTLVRDYHLRNPPNTKNLRHGQRAENHESLVLPLEEAYPVLRRCRENWGVRWVIKKAKHAVSMKISYEKRESMIKSWKDGQKAEAQHFLSQKFRNLPRIDPGDLEDMNGDMMDVDTEADAGTKFGATKEPKYERLMHKRASYDNVLASLKYSEPETMRYSLANEDTACAALFMESKAWLVAGPIRYDWQVRK